MSSTSAASFGSVSPSNRHGDKTVWHPGCGLDGRNISGSERLPAIIPKVSRWKHPLSHTTGAVLNASAMSGAWTEPKIVWRGPATGGLG